MLAMSPGLVRELLCLVIAVQAQWLAVATARG